MPAPYRDVWILAGLTLGAVMLANVSKERQHTATPGREAVAAPSRSQAIKDPDEVPPATGKELQQPAATINEQLTITERDIDIDIRSAFDTAVQSLLATPTPAEDEQPNDETPLSTLSAVAGQGGSTDPALAHSLHGSQIGRTGFTTTNVNMREGPAANYVLVLTLSGGAPLTILGEEAGWLHVREISTGREGWVNGRFVAEHVN